MGKSSMDVWGFGAGGYYCKFNDHQLSHVRGTVNDNQL